MKTKLTLLLAGVMAWQAVAADGQPAAAAAPSTSSLCSAGETRYFACTTRTGRSVALCGMAKGGVQYRYGRSAAAVELAYPAAPVAAVAAAASSAATEADLRFAHYSRPQTERYEVAFVNQGTRYAVFDYSEGRTRQAGVQVQVPGQPERQLVCSGRIDSRIHELQTRLPCDTDSALNLGSCR